MPRWPCANANEKRKQQIHSQHINPKLAAIALESFSQIKQLIASIQPHDNKRHRTIILTGNVGPITLEANTCNFLKHQPFSAGTNNHNSYLTFTKLTSA